MNRTIVFVLWCTVGLILCATNLASADLKPATAPAKSVDSPTAGRVLIGELNCAACHAASESQAKWLLPKTAPRLNEIGNRAHPDWIAGYLASPNEVMPGATMPDLLGHLPAAERAATAESLTHFLLSQSLPKARQILPDRAAVARGEALYHKVGCIACHAPQNAQIATKGNSPLPIMHEKWAFDGLRRFLRDPLASRPSGRMPSMNLSDGEAGDIAHYLLRESKVPATLELTQFRGQIRSLDDLDTAEISRTAPAGGFNLGDMNRNRGYALRFNGWLQIDKVADYTFYLKATGASRWSVDGKWLIGNDSWQSAAVDQKKTVRLEVGMHKVILDYVQRGPKEPELELLWEGPGLKRGSIPASQLRSSRDAVPEPQPFAVDAAKATKGRAIYAELNCAVCHEAKPIQNPPLALALVTPDRGCLAEQPLGKSPNFHLKAAARQSIRDAIAELNRRDLQPPAPQQRLVASITSLRCTACHARDGIGGVTPDRDPFFTSNGEDLGDEGRLPPRLDDVGDKLRVEAIAATLTKSAAVRPYINTRMPQFGETNTAHLPALFVTLDRQAKAIPASVDAPEVQRDAGRKLVGTAGLSCIACHRFNRQPGQTMQVVDLTTAGERLNEDWFRQFLIDPNRFHPGTRMPSFWPEGKSLLPTLLDGDTDRQHAALWTYLSDGERAKFPEGLSRQNMELIVGGEAVVYRGKLWEAGFRAIAVGYPGQLNMAFDAEEMRLSLLWRGRFLNAGPHWGVQGMGQIRPLGTDVIILPHGSPLAILPDPAAPWPADSSKALGMKFGGYQLDKLKQPTMLYSFGGAKIEELVTPLNTETQAGLRRTLSFVDPPADKLYLRLATGTLKSLNNGAWRLNDSVTITIKGGGNAMARGSGGQQELIFPIRFANKSGKLEVEYAW